MATQKAKELDHWIRHGFKDLNTELENAYKKLDKLTEVSAVGSREKQKLVTQGGKLIAGLLAEGNTDEGFDSGFDLLGNVGFFMAACERHEVNAVNTIEGAKQAIHSASSLSLQLGASLGVVPRFASAHLETHNAAHNGVYKTFTHLNSERLFLDYNTRGVLAYIHASEALLHALPLGISHSVSFDMFKAAKQALNDVIENNERLFNDLDVDSFFYHVRPYYKSHRVGLKDYRGANAGDFAGINIIDLLLGLCRADDAYYSQLLVDKFLFMRPEEQLLLRDCMRRPSLLDGFLESLSTAQTNTRWYQRNLAMFLEVCEAHGIGAQQHHNLLISKFIEAPAAQANLTQHSNITASGPPLEVMLRSLKKLSNLRSAANIEGLNTRFEDIQSLKQTLVAV